MPTRTAVMAEMAPKLGGYVGDIASGTATTAVLTDMEGFPDIEVGDILLMPNAASVGDTMRVLSAWTTATGTATWVGNRADTTYSSETYILLPRGSYTIAQIRQAINDTLRNTQRATRFYIPTRDDARHYPLADMTWLRSDKDVEAVFRTISPALIDNEDFTKWQNGTTSAPDSWSLSGSGASVARATTFASIGAYTCQLTRGGADATLTQDVPYQTAKQMIDDLADVAISVRVQATVAARVRVGINDGVNTTFSSYHSGDGEPEDLTATRTLTAAASRVQFVLSVDTGYTVGDFDFVGTEEAGSVQTSLTNAGSTSYRLLFVAHQTINVGGAPVIELAGQLGRGAQLVVISRREFAELSADTASTELDAETALYGALYHLYALHRKGEDRERPDRLMADYGATYLRRATALIDIPVPGPQQVAVIHAA